MQNELKKADSNGNNILLTAVFESVNDKRERFKKELKGLLDKYQAELTIEDFGRDYSSDKKIVVYFEYDEDLEKRTNDGFIPDWVIGTFLNCR
jgi:hypothetical protein